MTVPPSPLASSAMTVVEGCASVADTGGNLLFYTDGMTVFDATHTVMANGSGLLGSGSTGAVQGAMIYKQPGNSNIYYIVTAPAYQNTPYSFLYSIVDMNLASGQGSVTVKNSTLIPSGITEQLTGIRHCNGIDYWIVCRESNFAMGYINFYSFLLTSSGISTAPITSSFSIATTTVQAFSGGGMKISPNGKKLAVAANSLTLYDFDNSSGIITNELLLSSSAYGYSAEFSPDCSKLYISSVYLYQWNLCSGSDSAIVASQTAIATTTNNFISFTTMQLATDGKIYVCQSGFAYTPSVSVINSPNALGSACSFSYLSQATGTTGALWGLPNFIGTYFWQKPTVSPLTYTTLGQPCQTAAFHSPFTPGVSMGNCTATTFTLQNLVWDFGDPLSTSNNTSTVTNPTHLFTTTGTFTVKLIYNYGCGLGTDTIKQIVNIINSCFSVASTSITCASLGSATITAPNVAPYSYTWMPSAQTGSVATGLNPGAYTVTIFNPLNLTTQSLTTNFAPLIPLTGTIAKINSVSCYGASTGTGAITNLAGGSGNQTYLWTNGTTSLTTSATSLISAGLWSVNVTDALTGCQINQSFFINQPPALNLLLSSNTATACANGNAVLSGTNSGGSPFSTAPFYTFTWTAGPVGDTRTVTETTSGNYIYTLSSSDANNCIVSNTVAVNFILNPILSVVNASICPLSVGVITVSGATSYTWSASTTLSMTTGNSFTDNPLSNTQYTVVGTALGCTSAAMASIVLKQLPTVLISSNSPVCYGDNLSLTGFGASNYLWTGPNNFTSAVQIPTLTNVSLNNAGVYTVVAIAANSCTNSTTHTVVIYPSPTLSASGATVCTSQTLNLSANSSVTNFIWSGPQNFNSTLQNPFITSPTLSNSGTYTVKVTSAQGCTNSAFAVASVIPPPSLTSSLTSNGTLCAQALNGSPNSITLTAGGANTYTLFTPNHISNQNASGPSYSLSSLPPYISGPATATLMGSNGVCSVSLAIPFSVIPNPTLSPLTATPVICAGETFTYTSSGASSYTWGPNSPNLTTYSGPATVASPTQTSVYSVVGGSLGCYSGTQTSTITVRPLPQFSLSPIKPEICLNEKVTLTTLGNAESYTWSPYNGLSSMTGFTVSAGPLSQQTYTILGVLNTCTSTAMITVSVLPLPNPVATILNDKLCVGGLVTLQGSGGEGYNWKGPQDIKLGGPTATFVASSVNYSGTYILTVTDTNGCKNKTRADLVIYNLPGGNLFTDKKEACVPFTSEFKSALSSVNVLGNWTLENRTYSIKNFSHRFTSPGTYTINGNFKDTLTTCVSSNAFIVKANPNPVADFNFLPEKPIENLDEVIFTNESKGDQQTQWNWYFANNNGYQSQNKNTSYLFTDAGLYPVVMVVKNTWGCSDTIIKPIKVEADLAVYVPNVFTPNGDELNDIFIPVTRALKQYELSIFDRWGTKVFSTTNMESGWDGTFRGQECKMDVYVWKINLSSVNGEMKTLTGHVTLSR